MSSYKPNVRERLVARSLAAWRWETGRSGADVCKAAGFSQAKLSKIENAHHPIKPADVMALGLIYQVPEKERTLVYEAAERALVPGWWEELPPDVVADAVRDYLALESGAELARVFRTDLVPGLLQTRAYALALAKAFVPRPTEQVALSQVEARIKRQERLCQVEKPLTVHAILGEAVLRHPVGGSEVMKEQLRHLLKMGESDRVVLRVIPAAVGAHPALGYQFTILSFAEEHFDDVVYLEQLAGGRYVESPKGREPYTLNFAALQEVALSPGGSADLIAEVADGG
ncbi:helix-turn-helix domain-containing protein [Umezawaea tangerina]|uniref:Helix-turn-helix protein n=1 Tax=Umezawaea tangerina TaxID=84725 RepID=A0A2T0TKK3_9PSEU|nr:helix-turn-helix transcriptional regulator [Umezawaea tangerina]PRY46250.1 helix-turn-helix protein [Umezawaea tangerina]